MKGHILFLLSIFLSFVCCAQQSSREPDASQNPLDCHNPYNPVIIAQPTNQIICPGSNVSFTASAPTQSGSYWETSTDNGLTWSSSIDNAVYSFGNDTDTLTILGVTSQMNGYLYRCYYFGTCHGFSRTAAAGLTVAVNPVQLNLQPANVTACKNNSVDFMVAAFGSSIAYQWQESIDGGIIFVNISTKTLPLLHFDSVSIGMNNHQYRCTVTSNCSAAMVSNPATLTVNPENTVIVNQPTNQFVCSGNITMFSTTVTGPGIIYQWQRQEDNAEYDDIPGATSAQLSIPWISFDSNSGYAYRCRIISSCKTIYTNEVTATYLNPPLLADSVKKYACSGDDVNFMAVDYSQDTQYNFQWERSSDGGLNFSDSTGATTNYLSVTISVSLNNYKYRCHISNNCFDGFSNTMSLFVDVPIAIIKQPVSNDGCNTNASAEFTIKAAGSIDEYRWQKSTDGGATFNDLLFGIGLSTCTLSLEDITPSQNFEQYRCKITSHCFPTIYSNPATLTIFTKPELGADTIVTVPCDTCHTDISHLYQDTSFATLAWSTPNPVNAAAGKYKLKVFNTSGCYDSAFIYVNINKADTVKICKGSGTIITSNISGNSYQWQINTGGGFINLADGNNISGSSTSSIAISNIQATVQLICRVDNATTYSNVSSIKIAAYWNGGVSNEWNNPANWNCGEVPDFNTEVYILGSGLHYPEIESSTACKKLVMANGTSLQVKPGVSLTILGKE